MMTVTEKSSLDRLLKELLEQTLHLQAELMEDAEPEVWNELLDQRQSTIDQLNELFEAGNVLSEEQKAAYLVPVVEADRRLIPLMKSKKLTLGNEMARFQKSKAVNEQYGGYGSAPSAYGAFFDKRN